MSKNEQNVPGHKPEDFDEELTYPPNEDVYNQGMIEHNIDPENPSQLKAPVERTIENEEIPSLDQEFSRESPVDDLDVPGAELDDENEKIGGEDEENNYWSIGGDNHENLEEDTKSI